MKKTLAAVFFFMASAFSAIYGGVPYKVIVPMHEAQPGTMVYLINIDTGARVDSAAVADEHVTFTGDIDEPWYGRIASDEGRICNFIVEEGTVTINREKRCAVGMMLNDELNSITEDLNAIEEEIDNAQDEASFKEAYTRYMDTCKQGVIDNADSPIGYILFLEWSGLADANETIALIDENPWLKDYAKVQSRIESARAKLATSEGCDFIDFEVEYNGEVKRLSDYVGKGKYTLVDFWASWCGPCIQEIKVIKEIYNDYSEKGLQVLGVAVWDKPQDTEAAVERLKLPWPVIINSQNIATDLYGIPAIPCIIVFDPQGKIISRDARGAELKSVVAAAFAE